MTVAAAGAGFLAYVLSQLPAPPGRILEVGCGDEGGVTPALAAAGYDVIGIDPHAPEGERFQRTTIEAFEDPAPFDAVIAARVLHHVDPLDAAVEKLARLAPLLIVDEFACDRIDDAARDWYRLQYRSRGAAGVERRAPQDLDEWRSAHAGLHPCDVVRNALDRCYDARDFRWEPYLYRWLGGSETKAREEAMIERGVLQPIGFRYTGVRLT
ncbi:MAG: class I SAM-dependent methyltransferase [Gaiellaceae bacterium]